MKSVVIVPIIDKVLKAITDIGKVQIEFTGVEYDPKTMIAKAESVKIKVGYDTHCL